MCLVLSVFEHFILLRVVSVMDVKTQILIIARTGRNVINYLRELRNKFKAYSHAGMKKNQ